MKNFLKLLAFYIFIVTAILAYVFFISERADESLSISYGKEK